MGGQHCIEASYNWETEESFSTMHCEKTASIASLAFLDIVK